MKTNVTCLWFDNEALEAAEFYCSILGGEILYKTFYYEGSQMPEGTVFTVRFKLFGKEFDALNAGAYFKFTPANSLFVECDTDDRLLKVWNQFLANGEILMDLADGYSFVNGKYGWIKDRYGLTWQICSTGQNKISNFLLLTGSNYGKAQEAAEYYCTLFEDSKINKISEIVGSNFICFSLGETDFMIFESNKKHKFTFNESVSYYILCENQEEIDSIWEAITSAGEEQPCGWAKDKYGVSWQIVTNDFEKIMLCKDAAKIRKVMEKLYGMKKIRIQELLDVFNDKN